VLSQLFDSNDLFTKSLLLKLGVVKYSQVQKKRPDLEPSPAWKRRSTEEQTLATAQRVCGVIARCSDAALTVAKLAQDKDIAASSVINGVINWLKTRT
jgi:hypothetical protein